MNKIDTNVLGNSDSQITKVSGQNLKQEHTHISTAVSAAMNLQTLKPNHCLQRFAMNVLVLSVILMTANTNVFASSCNSNQDTDSCPGSGIPGPAGPAGADGDSAYQVAVNNGFIGTEEAWLESLQGTDGVDGINGINGLDGKDGVDGLNGLDGVKGDTGAQGE